MSRYFKANCLCMRVSLEAFHDDAVTPCFACLHYLLGLPVRPSNGRRLWLCTPLSSSSENTLVQLQGIDDNA